MSCAVCAVFSEQSMDTLHSANAYQWIYANAKLRTRRASRSNLVLVRCQMCQMHLSPNGLSLFLSKLACYPWFKKCCLQLMAIRQGGDPGKGSICFSLRSVRISVKLTHCRRLCLWWISWQRFSRNESSEVIPCRCRSRSMPLGLLSKLIFKRFSVSNKYILYEFHSMSTIPKSKEYQIE